MLGNFWTTPKDGNWLLRDPTMRLEVRTYSTTPWSPGKGRGTGGWINCQWLNKLCLCNEAPIKFQKDWVWRASMLLNMCRFGGELTHWKRLWCLEGFGAGGEVDDRGWDGWMASPTHRTWVWGNSGSWWWTGKLGVLRFMGWQRVGHDWATELNWTLLSKDHGSLVTFPISSLLYFFHLNVPLYRKLYPILCNGLYWEKNLKKRRYMCTYNWMTLLCNRN